MQCTWKLGPVNTFPRGMLRVMHKLTSKLRAGIQIAGRRCPGPASGALQSAKVPSRCRRGAGNSGSALGPVAAATIDGCWPRGKQVYNGSISGHQNSMFKAIAPNVALIYTSCINVQSGREINAIC